MSNDIDDILDQLVEKEQAYRDEQTDAINDDDIRAAYYGGMVEAIMTARRTIKYAFINNGESQ